MHGRTPMQTELLLDAAGEFLDAELGPTYSRAITTGTSLLSSSLDAERDFDTKAIYDLLGVHLTAEACLKIGISSFGAKLFVAQVAKEVFDATWEYYHEQNLHNGIADALADDVFLDGHPDGAGTYDVTLFNAGEPIESLSLGTLRYVNGGQDVAFFEECPPVEALATGETCVFAEVSETWWSSQGSLRPELWRSDHPIRREAAAGDRQSSARSGAASQGSPFSHPDASPPRGKRRRRSGADLRCWRGWRGRDT